MNYLKPYQLNQLFSITIPYKYHNKYTLLSFSIFEYNNTNSCKMYDLQAKVLQINSISDFQICIVSTATIIPFLNDHANPCTRFKANANNIQNHNKQ